MNIQFTARHFEATPDLQRFAESSVAGLSHLYDGIYTADIILDERPHGGRNQAAEIVLSVYKEQLVAKEESNDIKQSINACVIKLERQLQRYKEKLHASQHPRAVPETIPEVVGDGDIALDSMI